MHFQQIRRRADQLRAIPLESVLRISGAQPDRHDKRKWHTAQGTLSVNGAKFINWNHGLGGGGAIDLVIHLHRSSFKEALDWLGQHFPDTAHPSPQPSTHADLTLPAPDPNKLQRVINYLLTQRCLPPSLIDPLIRNGTLYADHRANAVFLLLELRPVEACAPEGKQNIPVGAELRGSTPTPWRGMAPGSRKDLGFFSIPADQRPQIVLCESAIDAISCFALHPQYRCISTAGARPNPLWLPSLLNQGFHLYCGFDADPTGDAMAHALIALHPSVQRLRPCQHDWNDLLISQS